MKGFLKMGVDERIVKMSSLGDCGAPLWITFKSYPQPETPPRLLENYQNAVL